MSRTLSSSKGNVGFLWKRCGIKGPPHAFRGEFRSLHGGVPGSLAFLPSCVSNCVTPCVSSVKSDLLWCYKEHLGIPRASMQE